MSHLELTLIAGQPQAYVHQSNNSAVVLADTVVANTVTVEFGDARTHPSVDFPAALVGRRVEVRFRRRADVATGVLESFDADWLHIGIADSKSRESIRRRDVSTIHAEADEPHPIAPVPDTVRYACTGIGASVSMVYHANNHQLFTTLCVRNETSLIGDASITYIEQAPHAMAVSQYETEVAPRSFALARAAPPAEPTTAAANPRADYRATVHGVQLVRGANFVKLESADRLDMTPEWIVRADREPLLRYRANFSAETPRPEFLASGRFALRAQPERVTALNPWRSERALIADFPNDGTLAVAHVQHSVARRGTAQLVQRRLEIWNRAADAVDVAVHLVLAAAEQFSRPSPVPSGETTMAPVGADTVDITGMMRIIANVESQAIARKEAERLELGYSGGTTITVGALDDPETGASPQTAVYRVNVPARSMAVVLYQIATTQ